uniref:G-protein coupled receptors family 1 profile domain-containing protein n=1 Tax=Sinocyclocheilus grahami TaxID=75366 RepID=A0A672K220_SINGR
FCTNGSNRNECEINCLDSLSRGNNCLPARSTSPGVAATLAGVLIFTTVADIVGNLLVILSVYRNKKLRNAGV